MPIAVCESCDRIVDLDDHDETQCAEIHCALCDRVLGPDHDELRCAEYALNLVSACRTLKEAAASSIEAINQGEPDIAYLYLRVAIRKVRNAEEKFGTRLVAFQGEVE
jgi:hypothetical protein